MKRTGFKKKFKPFKTKNVKIKTTKTVKKSSKPKLRSVKHLENLVWAECKRIVRKRNLEQYTSLTCYTCGKSNLEGFQAHTGHFRKKGSVPMQMKYDLRILRVQCNTCNLFYDGNEAVYATRLIRDEGHEYVLKIDDDIKYYKQNIMGAAGSREFLMNLLAVYKLL